MKKALLFFVIVIMLAGCSASPRIAHIVAFGDEFSDNGNAYKNWNEAAEKGQVPPGLMKVWQQNKPALWEGRWSNGPVAVEVLADRLKVGLTNYAVTGAMSGYGSYLSEMSDLDLFKNSGLFGQIDKYEAELAGKKADAGSLYFIEIGMVDISTKLENKAVNSDQEAEYIADQVVGNLSTAIKWLANLGAKQFLVGNSLDYSSLPAFVSMDPEGKSKLFQTRMNSTLPGAMEKLAQQMNIKIDIFDYAAIEERIRSNPDQYGLTQLSSPCTGLAPDFDGICEKPDEYYYYGYYFLTRRVHQIMGEAMAEQLMGNE